MTLSQTASAPGAPAGAERPPAPGKRERTKAANRAAILAAAREVFAEMGYGAATLRDVHRRTGLSIGTLYNYFPDKESLLRALVLENATELTRRLREARAAAGTLEEFVGDSYRAYFQFIAEDPSSVELLSRNAGTIRALFDEPALAAGVGDLLEDLRAAVGRGLLPELDADYMAHAMAGVGVEIALRMVERDPIDVEGAARFATELFLGGIERLSRRS